MLDGTATWYGRVNEHGTYSVLARLTSLDGTGTQVIPEEGNCLVQADVTSITCKVFELGTNKDNTVGVQITPAPTLTPSANIFDLLRTVGWPTSRDRAGYNFRHDVAVGYTPTADEWFLLEYKVTLVGGGILWLRVKVKSVRIQS